MSMPNPAFKITKNCQQCGKAFVSWIKENRIFCCKACLYASRNGIPFRERTGSYLKCEICNKEIYVQAHKISVSKHHFCSATCRQKIKSPKMVSLPCKICNKQFDTYQSEIVKAEKRGHKKQYCSITCRNADTNRMTEKAQLMNKIQLEKKGLNKLELFGREWLTTLGFLQSVDFVEQHLLFDKFCVDVYFPREKVVVQFDGHYWHEKPKRKKLDLSQDAYLSRCGVKVVRITDIEMKTKDIAVYQQVTERFMQSLVGQQVPITFNTTHLCLAQLDS